MSIAIRTVTPSQVRAVNQRIRYRAGRPVAYLCPDCLDWHDHAAPKLYDAARGRYHGTACAGSDSLLTARQTEVLALVAWGHTNATIARTLDVALQTVKTHTTAIYRALGLTWAAGSPRVLATRWYHLHAEADAA